MNSFNIGSVAMTWAQERKFNFWYESETSSTNLIAKEPPFFGTSFKLFLTNHQEMGRGRGSNQWLDQNGGQLLSTWSFYSSNAPQPVISIQIGLALYEALSTVWSNLNFSLKAPNDLFLNSEKLAGLLIEVISQNGYQIIIGLGLNVFSSPQNLEKRATGLSGHIEVTKNDFKKFLDLFFIKTQSAILNSSKTLTITEQEKIIEALNRHPLLNEPYSAIDAVGNITSPSKTIHWSEL